MDYRFHLKSKNKVSLLGFGCMRLPTIGGDPKKIDVALATQMLQYGYDHGVNYFDTAYPYHGGQSQAFLGEFLSKLPRNSFYLANKCPVWLIKKTEDVRRIFEEQLNVCKVSYFDYYLMHAMDQTNLETDLKYHIYDELRKLKDEGKIKNLGFSFHDNIHVFQKIISTHHFDFAQIQFNYLDYDGIIDSNKLYQIAKDNDLQLVIMEPVRGGALAKLPQECSKLLENHQPKRSNASYALRFVGSFDNVMVILSGMSSLDQVIDNVTTFSPFIPLDKEEEALIEKVKVLYRSNNPIPCTACRYCLPCTNKVNIPRVFAIYNEYQSSKNDWTLKGHLKNLNAEEYPSNCIDCKACVSKCPQKINIPEALKKCVKIVK